MIATMWHRRLRLSEGLFQATLIMIGARVTGTIPSIAAIGRCIKLCYCSIIMQHLINGRNSLPGIVLTLTVCKPDLKMLLLAFH